MNGYNFTERVRRVLFLARSEASRLHHEYVGTEHILLGLIREGNGTAMNVMIELGATPAALVAQIDSTIVRGKAADDDRCDRPYTSRAKKVLELSMTEARELRHTYVGTEHLLLGLLREEHGIAALLLNEAGITLDLARKEVARELGLRPSRGQEASQPAAGRQGPYRIISRTAERLPADAGGGSDRFIRAFENAHQAAIDRGSPQVTAEHVVLAILADGGGTANAALRLLGLDASRLVQALDVATRREDVPRGDRAAPNVEPDAHVSAALALMLDERREATTGNLLVAILDTVPSVATVFASHGVTAAAVRAELERMQG